MKLHGKDLGEITTDQLKAILAQMQSRLDERNKVKSIFASSRTVKGAKVKKMQFPPPNPNFLKLKDIIENELKVRS
jgi:hypothetical protein